jgi:hypothetical protein
MNYQKGKIQRIQNSEKRDPKTKMSIINRFKANLLLISIKLRSLCNPYYST